MSKKRTKHTKNERPTVTILTVKQLYKRGETSELTLAFESREQALDALQRHVTNAEAITTINIRTLDVLTDAMMERPNA
jgi:hypothetical protein